MVSLTGASLRGADLRGADLSNGLADGADFRGADLRGANLSNLDLAGAKMKGARLGGATVCDTIMPDGTVSHPVRGLCPEARFSPYAPNAPPMRVYKPDPLYAVIRAFGRRFTRER